MAGVISPAQAATSTAYITSWTTPGTTIALSANDPYAIQTRNITVGDQPMYLAATPDGTQVYVPNQFSPLPGPTAAGVGIKASLGIGNVSVIDTADNSVTTIDHGSFYNPYAVAVSPDGLEAWVVNSGTNTVSIIDTRTNTVTGTISDGCLYYATGIAFNPISSRHEAYVVGRPEGDALCVVDTTSRTVIDEVPLNPGGSLGDFAVVTPDGAKVYVTGSEISRINTIPDPISGNREVIYIPLSDLSTTSYLAVSGTKLYAAGNDYFLEVYDTTTDGFLGYVDFIVNGATTINAVTIVPGTTLGLVTDTEVNEVYAFDTSAGEGGIGAEIDPPASANLDGTPFAIIAITKGGTTPPTPGNLTLDKNGMGDGLIGTCGMVVGRDGKGPMSAGESAGMIALYFALLLLPVGILKIVQRRKRLPFEKAGIVALFVVASMLAVSSAHAMRLIAPKAQRFHPTTDGLGALTVDTDQTLCPGQFHFGLDLSVASRPLDMGDTHKLEVEKTVVDELYTADLTVAYGLTPDITLGLDIPYDYSRDNLDYARFKQSGESVRDDVFHLGDIRVNAKFRVIEGARYGLAIIPFANFPSGEKDHLLSEGKFGFGMKLAGHYDAAKPLTLYANLGAEHIGDVTAGSANEHYYSPWIQYGVGAKYLLPWRKDSIVAEVNGETAWATPFGHSTLSPLEALAAYRTVVAPKWTLQVGGGAGLNKGMGAPQWRAILGIAYNM
jgi:YVTN family beta-propeller protein